MLLVPNWNQSLTVLSESYPDRHGHTMVVVKCDCGNEKRMALNSIKSGRYKTCGCLRLIKLKEKITKHGLTNHLIFKLWMHLKNRCYNPSCKSFKDYGERGVTVCQEWLKDFKNFYDWCIANGWQKGLQIDKDIKYKERHGTPTGKSYSPEYCCFVTNIVNAQTKRNTIFYTFNGEIKTIRQWSDTYGIPYKTLDCRLRREKLSIEDAIFTPSRYKGKWETPIKPMPPIQ